MWGHLVQRELSPAYSYYLPTIHQTFVICCCHSLP